MRVSGKHNDLDNVGPSHRHHTFFEMLGNFSFGDYFKADAIRFAWELLTEVWKLPPDKLVPSIFKGENGIPRDDEAYELWRTATCPSDRILELGARRQLLADGRYRTVRPLLGDLLRPRVRQRSRDRDLEQRLHGVRAGRDGTSRRRCRRPRSTPGWASSASPRCCRGRTPTTTPICSRRSSVGSASSPVAATAPTGSRDVSMRVVADHVRATTFLIADGVIPSNEWRGYVLRKIMRRAMRHGKHLGLTEPFLHRLVAVLGPRDGRRLPRAGPQPGDDREDDPRGGAAVRHGADRRSAAARSGDRQGAGTAGTRPVGRRRVPSLRHVRASVRLHRGHGGDAGRPRRPGRLRAGHAGRSAIRRAARAHSAPAAARRIRGRRARLAQDGDGSVRGLHHDPRGRGAGAGVVRRRRQPIEALGAGETGFVALARTPFYLEAGGQVSDTGRLLGAATGSVAVVEGISRIGPGLPRAHQVRVESGTLHVGDIVTAEVDAAPARRDPPQSHGDASAARGAPAGARRARQAGGIARRARSSALRLRPLPADHGRRARSHRADRQRADRREHARCRPRCGRRPRRSRPARWRSSARSTATRSASVSVPGFSMELCGGTHVRATGDIGFFAVVSESGVAAGIRRIEAVTGAGAVQWAQRQRTALNRIVEALNVNADQAVEAIEKLQGETKRLTRDVSQLKTKVALGGGGAAGGRHRRGRRREAGAAQGRRSRQGCAPRPRRLAEGRRSRAASS